MDNYLNQADFRGDMSGLLESLPCYPFGYYIHFMGEGNESQEEKYLGLIKKGFRMNFIRKPSH